MSRGARPFGRRRGREAWLAAFCSKVGLPTPGEVAAEAAQDKAKA